MTRPAYLTGPGAIPDGAERVTLTHAQRAVLLQVSRGQGWEDRQDRSVRALVARGVLTPTGRETLRGMAVVGALLAWRREEARRSRLARPIPDGLRELPWEDLHGYVTFTLPRFYGTHAAETFFLHDQPMTCPACGSRTNWHGAEHGHGHGLRPGQELHECLNDACRFPFFAEHDSN